MDRRERAQAMRLFHPNRLNFIFLVPVTVAASNGGCLQTSTVEDPIALDRNGVVQVLTDNTLTQAQSAQPPSYVLVESDGALIAKDTPHGGTQGEWSVDAEGVVCVRWLDLPEQPRLCDQVTYRDGTRVRWAGHELRLLPGNPQGL